MLDAVADATKKVIPDKHEAKVDEVRANLDGSIGNDEVGGTER